MVPSRDRARDSRIRDRLHRVFRWREISGRQTCLRLRAALRISLHLQRGNFALAGRMRP